MNDMGLKLPPAHVDMEEIRNKYHIAEQEQAKRNGRTGLVNQA